MRLHPEQLGLLILVGLAFAVLVGLKLVGLIQMPWLAVTLMPLLLPLSLNIVGIAIVGLLRFVELMALWITDRLN